MDTKKKKKKYQLLKKFLKKNGINKQLKIKLAL